LKPATIRSADPDRDAAACVAIYAPFVEAGATSFEEVPPTPGDGPPPEPQPPEGRPRLPLADA
jgi:hypothetical protein